MQIYSRTLSSNDVPYGIIFNNGNNTVYVSAKSTTASDSLYLMLEYDQATTTIPADTLPPVQQWAYYENKGQVTDTGAHQASYIQYYTNTANPRVYISDHGISYVYDRRDTLTDTLQRIDMIFHTAEGGSDAPDPSGTYYGSEQIDPYLNYYIGGLPQFYEAVHGYQRLTTKALYPSIDWQMYSDAGGPKYYYVVQPGGNPADILFQYQGADSTWSDSIGLHIATRYGSLTSSVTAYQGSAAVPISIATYGGDYYYFTVGTYDATQPLTIMVSQQPAASSASASDNLDWCTYWGGNNNDEGEVVNITDNYKLVAGLTDSPDFPVTTGLTSNSQYNEGSFLSKFNTGDSVVWSTFYSSVGSVFAHHYTTALTSTYPIGKTESTTDQLAYIGGATANQHLLIVNMGSGAYIDSTYNGGIFDGYMAIFNANTGALVHSTYIGSDSDDEISNLTADLSTLNVFLTGNSRGTNFPHVNTFAGSGNFYDTTGRGVIMEFNGSANLLLSTGFGSSQIDLQSNSTFISDSKIDYDGSLIITGSTPFSFSYPGITLPAGAYTQAYKAGTTSQAFLAKFKKMSGSSDKFSLYYYSLFGGTDATYGDKVCFNSANDMYMVGHSGCDSFPVYPAGSCAGGGNMFISRFNTDGIQRYANIKPNTLIMGQLSDIYNNSGIILTGSGQSKREGDILCDNKDNLFVYGLAKRTGGSVSVHSHTGYYCDSSSGQKGVILEYDSQQNLIWGTFFGGSLVQYAGGMALENNKYLYICGSTSSHGTDPYGNLDFPIRFEQGATNVSIYNENTNLDADWEDAFIAKFDIGEDVSTNISNIQVQGINSLLRCYPNPSYGAFSLDLSSFGDGVKSISVYDQLGRVVFATTSDMQIATVNMINISQGMYIVEVSGNGKKDAAKIIIKDIK